MRRAGFANERRLTLFPPPSPPYCCFSPSEEEEAAAAAAIAFGLVGADADEDEVEAASHFLRSFGPT